MLERNNHGLAYRNHEAENESTLLLVTATGFVSPTCNEGCETTVASVHDEDGHSELVGDIPCSENGVVEDHQTSDDTAHQSATSKPVCDKASGYHENKVDRTNARWDIVDLRDRVPARGLQVEGKLLHDVAAKY